MHLSKIFRVWRDQHEDIQLSAMRSMRRFRTWVQKIGLEPHEDGYTFMVKDPQKYMLACIKYGFHHTTP